jgi:polyhydroxyalkanoate synthesis regulator phasin
MTVLDRPVRSLEEIRDELGARLDRMRELDPEIPELRKRIAELDDIIARRITHA